MRILGWILAALIGLFVLLYVIGLFLPDDGRSGGGRYKSLSHCLSEVETPDMKAGAESNAPAVSHCSRWRDYR